MKSVYIAYLGKATREFAARSYYLPRRDAVQDEESRRPRTGIVYIVNKRRCSSDIDVDYFCVLLSLEIM